MMNLSRLWMNLFGTTQWLGINLGFWVSMFLCALIVVVMNVVFWGMKPKRNEDNTAEDK
ncbi:MAG: conjugal transfer protein [Lacrimispora sphenoides]